jgi:hypothetical protein
VLLLVLFRAEQPIQRLLRCQLREEEIHRGSRLRKRLTSRPPAKWHGGGPPCPGTAHTDEIIGRVTDPSGAAFQA